MSAQASLSSSLISPPYYRGERRIEFINIVYDRERRLSISGRHTAVGRILNEGRDGILSLPVPPAPFDAYVRLRVYRRVGEGATPWLWYFSREKIERIVSPAGLTEFIVPPWSWGPPVPPDEMGLLRLEAVPPRRRYKRRKRLLLIAVELRGKNGGVMPSPDKLPIAMAIKPSKRMTGKLAVLVYELEPDEPQPPLLQWRRACSSGGCRIETKPATSH